MKMLSLLLHRVRSAVGAVALITALSAASLWAQNTTSVEVSLGTSLSLPADWKIMDRASETAPPQPVRSSTDPQAATLLLTARPADAGRNVLLSMFRTNFRSMGPSLRMGEMGAQAEAGMLLQSVLSQGFSPSATRITQSTSSQGTPLVTIEVTAKNAAGEERIFSDTAISQRFSTLRLCSSRPVSDQTGAQELASIVQSLTVADDSSNMARQPPTGIPSNSATGTAAAATSPGSQMLGARTSAAFAPPVGTSLEAAQLVRDYHGALIIVEGQKGVGSGFLCTLEGKACAITNAHVLSDNVGVKLTTLNGMVLNASASAIAVGHDAVKLEIANAPKAFEPMVDLDRNVKIGDAVVIPGNAEGARVVTAVEGKIVGIGPNLIEVDAPFVKGNSGSPIVHRATGKVLGVATYLIERKVSQGATSAVQIQTRRFGFRLDSVKQWEALNWPRFFAQSAQVAKIETMSDDFIKMFEDARTTHRFEPRNYSSPLLQRPVQTFVDAATKGGKTMSANDRKELLRRLFADLRGAARSDINAFDSRAAYDYFRRQVETQSRFRDELYNVFTRLMESRGE